MRIWKSDHLWISKFCDENGISQANWIRTLLENYRKLNGDDFCKVEVKINELTQNIIMLEKEIKVLQELLEYKDGRIKEMNKRIFQLQEKVGQVEDKNKELEIRIKM